MANATTNTSTHPVLPFRVTFDEGPHTYTMTPSDGMGGMLPEALTSVTTFIAHYFPHFDTDAQAVASAARRGKTPEQLKREWEEAGKAACELGTRVHENQEDLMCGRKPRNMPRDEREKAIMVAGWKALMQLRAEGWAPYAAEMMVFSPTLHLAGTVDAIFTRGREWLIADWKTNKEINTESRYGEKCLEPIPNTDACEMSKYGLQLSVYERMLFEGAYISGPRSSASRRIIHLTPGGFNFHTPPAMELETVTILLDLLQTRWDLPDAPF